jgi:hypothetical protein
MSEEQSSFKVTDRRLFNADGTPRELSPEEKQATESRLPGGGVSSDAAPKATAPTGQQAESAQTQTRPTPTSSGREDRNTADEGEPDDARDPASFINFIMSIASNAAASLGMMEHPVTHEREVDLELAKHWIDVLGMLQKKTRSNLTSQEQQIVEGLLSDLRMQYVSLAESPQARVARPFSGRDIVGGK